MRGTVSKEIRRIAVLAGKTGDKPFIKALKDAWNRTPRNKRSVKKLKEKVNKRVHKSMGEIQWHTNFGL